MYERLVIKSHVINYGHVPANRAYRLCGLIRFKTQKHFWLSFRLNNAVCVAGIRGSALSKAVTYSWTELPFLYRHYVSHFTMLTLYPCGVSIRHSPNSKQASFCGKYQNLILWPVLTFCEKKLLVGTTEYWAFLGLTKECLHVYRFFKNNILLNTLKACPLQSVAQT